MKDQPYIVIMAGGVGSRFWPYSKSSKPKQFLDVLGTGRTLLQMTFDRFREIAPAEQFYVVTNQAHASLVSEQLPELLDHQILAEPLRKNTAACLAFAAYKISSLDPNATMVPTVQKTIGTPTSMPAVPKSKGITTLEKLIVIKRKPNAWPC